MKYRIWGLCLVMVLLVAACNFPANEAALETATPPVLTLSDEDGTAEGEEAAADEDAAADDPFAEADETEEAAVNEDSEADSGDAAGNGDGGLIDIYSGSGTGSSAGGSGGGSTAGGVNTSGGGNTSGGMSTSGRATGCVVSSSWPVYVVTRGDTLTSIARRVGSTASILATVNCLADPNNLNVGQVLHVPRQPVSGTPLVNPAVPDPGTYGRLSVEPYRSVINFATGNRYELTPGSTVTVRWVGYPAGLSQIEAAYIPHAPGQSTISLGTDTDLSDGVSFTWTVPQHADGRLQVSSRLPGQFHEFVVSPGLLVTASSVYVPPTLTPHVPPPTLTPHVSTPFPTLTPDRPDSDTYGTLTIGPSISVEPFSGTQRYRVAVGPSVVVNWLGGPLELTQVEFTYVPLDQTQPSVSLGIDTNPADGWAVLWAVPEYTDGYVIANGRWPDATRERAYSQEIWVTTAL